MQDSFTTAKDRGAEWFYPLTRLIKRGALNAQGLKEPDIVAGSIYFYQEDPQGLIEYADKDLQEPDDKATPWRRVYGPALNSCLLDRGFLVGSLFLIVVWLIAPDLSHAKVFVQPISYYYPFLAGFAFFGLVYLSGELDRRDRVEPLKAIPKTMIKHNNVLKKPILIAGILFLGVWLILYRLAIWQNLVAVASNWIVISFGAISIVVAALVVIKYQSSFNKKNDMPVIV